MNEPLISVIIPTYNHLVELMTCLLKLEKQTYRPFEVIVVDDASTDGTSELLNSCKPTYPFAHYRLERNQGAPAARNEGFRHSRGQFVLFLDADTVMVETALAQMAQALVDHPEAAFVYSDFYFGWKKMPAREFDVAALRRCNYIDTSSLLRREAFPGFDESLKKFHDWDLWLTIVERGGQGIWINQPLFTKQTKKSYYSQWLPSSMHRLPWQWIGWMPREIKRYREGTAIIKQKHGL